MSLGITLPLFTIDAFSDVPFAGNQAAICLDTTEKGLSEELMQKIAAEMNISETAYITKQPGDTFKEGSKFGLRWFTPTTEVPLCGHATLASSAALFFCQENTSEQLVFSTLSGDLFAKREGNLISLDLPLNTPAEYENEAVLKDLIKAAVGDRKVNCVRYSPTTRKLLIRLDDSYTRSDLEGLKPDSDSLLASVTEEAGIRGVIVTLKNDGSAADKDGRVYDFLSRYFAPWVGIPEDPVTGSAHTVLAGYWSQALDKKVMYARQCSARGGSVQVSLMENGRVGVAGPATVLVRGTITV